MSGLIKDSKLLHGLNRMAEAINPYSSVWFDGGFVCMKISVERRSFDSYFAATSFLINILRGRAKLLTLMADEYDEEKNSKPIGG